MRSSISNMIKKILPILFIIVLGIFMFWDKGENFLTPNTFNNIGDTCFPLNINYANSYLYSWDVRGNFGFGQVNLCPTVLPMYLFVWLWSILGLPLWIANRLWHVLPNILIGLGALYLYRSLFKSKYSWICGVIASVFIMLLPDRNIFAHGSMGFAGTLFILGASIRGLFSEYTGSSKRNAVIMFSFGTVMAIHYPRCLYITFIIVGLISALTFYFYRKKKQNYIPIFKFISSCIILALLLSLFWIIPLSLQLTQGRESLVPASEILGERETFYKVHQKMTNPAYILRATTGGSGTGRPSHYYFSHPLILPFSFLIPLYCLLPLLLKNVSRKIKLLIFSSVLLTLYPVSFHISPTINMFLRNHIPGFWMMNDPSYWLLYVGVCYGLIIGSMTEHFLKLMKDDKAKKVIFAACVSIVVLIFGGGVLLDRALLPGFVHKYTLFGNKLPYVKIPEEYDKVEKYLTKYARTNDRVWYINTANYKRYTWSYKGHQPEILFFKSPIPAVGEPLIYATPMIDLLSDSVDSRKYGPEEGLNLALLLGKISNIKYLFLHKDYFFEVDRDLNNYVRKKVIKKKDFKVVMNTNKFTLYENKDFSLGPIYSSRIATVIAGDLDTLSWIAQTNPHIQKPLFVFVKQCGSMEKFIPAMRAFIFSNSNPLDLALQSLEPDYGVKISDSKKPVVFEVKEEGIYEVYAKDAKCKMPASSADRQNAKLEIEIDEKSLILDPESSILEKAVKWKRIGRIELKKGGHRIAVEERPLKLVIVPKEKLVETEERVQNYLKKAETPPTYFFSKELSSDIDSREERSVKGSFYLPSSGNYSLRAKISPQYVKAPDYGFQEKMGKSLKEWSFVSRNVRYFTSTAKDILTVGTYFDGDSGEREFLGLKRNIKPVDIEHYPNFEIDYRLANPEVQRIEAILGIDLNNDRKIDIRIVQELPPGQEKEFTNYTFNLYKEVRDSLGQSLPADPSFHLNGEVRNFLGQNLPADTSFRLIRIYLKISKREGFDCSTFPDRGWYKTSFKNFGLYGFSEGKCVKKRNYAFNERIGRSSEFGVRSSESPPAARGEPRFRRETDQPLAEKRGKSKVILSRSFKGLDLEKYPYINRIHQNKDPRNLSVSIILYLDFDGDGKSDGKVTYEGVTAKHLFFDAHQFARAKFPDKNLYHLIKLEIKVSRAYVFSLGDVPKEPSFPLSLQHLQIYNEEILPYEEVHLMPPMLKIDRRKLSLTKSGSWYTAQTTYLKEGYHILDVLFPGIETKLDFVAIEPISRIQDPGSRIEPEITFQKINPAKYRVKVKNAKEPFCLIFSESFHEGWKAYVKSVNSEQFTVNRKNRFEWSALVSAWKDRGKRIELKEHFMVNGYANGWFVPTGQFTVDSLQFTEKKQNEEFEIILYFWPQSLFYLGLGISGLTLLGCVGYLVGTGVRRKKRRAGGKVSR